jgi:succinoglycan biosynthesis protein ExoA
VTSASTETGTAGTPSALPFVSVIIPVRNEERHLRDCLEALASQDYPRERFEVIVLDGESSDATPRVAEEAAAALGLPDVFLVNAGRTTASGLNLGLRAARGEVIVRVDGHAVVDPSFLSASVRALQDSGADAVGGTIRTRGLGLVGGAIALAVSSPFGVGDAAFRHANDERWVDSVAFAAYRRSVFERLGAFAEDIDKGEDDEFNYRLLDAGGRILLTPAIGSTYYARSRYADLARQYWAYGLAKARVLRRHPGRLRARHLVPSALVSTLLLSSLLSPVSRAARCILALAGGSYALAVALASFRLARRSDAGYLPLLPPAFAAVHFSAGLGFLVGLLRELAGAMRRP